MIFDNQKYSDTQIVEHVHVYGEWISSYPNGAYRVCEECGEKDELVNMYLDVKDDVYYIPILWATENKITTGYNKTTFNPNQTCTRAQVVTFLWRAAGSPEPETTVNPVKDVREGDFYKAILWAYENGITTGVTPTTFNPNGTCTRGQIVTFIYRYAHEPEVNMTSNPFRDVDDKNAFLKAILWASENQITQGTGNTFNPRGKCTRAQTVTFLYRYLTLTN